VDIGRGIVERKVQRGAGAKALRWSLKEGLTSSLFTPAMKLGQSVRGLLPGRLREKVPARQEAGAWPTRTHARKVLMLAGCVQPAMMPNINTATARVLDAAGIQTLVAPEAGCCGAIRFHLNDHDGGRAQMRANIDAWWPYVERSEVEAIVMNASGCGVTVREYGHYLQHDPAYAEKARRIGALTRDLSEVVAGLVPQLQDKVRANAGVFAYHPPCTLQHGQKLRGGVEQTMRALGFDVRVAINESHLCCGSAGTYSVLHPEIAHTLRDRKLEHLGALEPAQILSANIGCIQHLQTGTDKPVRHWVEVLDEALAKT
jgi:glycolate oxidase iron-sulfur subunit